MHCESPLMDLTYDRHWNHTFDTCVFFMQDNLSKQSMALVLIS
jgi:hypothetical protein